jgi:hypothetical protein
VKATTGAAVERLGLEALAPGGVVGDDDLEARSVERLLLQRVEQPAQPQGAIVRGHGDGDLRPGAHRNGVR